jgi:hypothetical protein
MTDWERGRRFGFNQGLFWGIVSAGLGVLTGIWLAGRIWP